MNSTRNSTLELEVFGSDEGKVMEAIETSVQKWGK